MADSTAEVIRVERTCGNGYVIMRNRGVIVCASIKPIVTWFEADQELNTLAEEYLASLERETHGTSATKS